MATPDEARAALRMPGRLVYGPTQNGLLGAFPHGGTALGVIGAVALDVASELVRVLQWEHGAYAPRGYLDSETVSLAFVLRQVEDPDALGLFFRTTTTSAGGYTGAKTIKARTRGQVAALASPLLFAPYDLTHRAVLIHAPLVVIPPQRVAFGNDAAVEWALAVLATRHDTLGEEYAIDKLEHLSLT